MPDAKIEGLKIERLKVEPTPEAIEHAVGKLAEGQKSFDPAPAKHKAETGDLVLMDFEGKVDGEPFEGGKGEGMSVELGSGRLIPGFEDQLIGAKANEQRTISVTFPEDYNVAYLKGRAATFDVLVNEVQRPKEMKADAFAQSMACGRSASELLKGSSSRAEWPDPTHMKRQLLDQLAETHDFPVPESMVEAEFQQIWQQLEQEASREEDPAAARKEMEDEKADYRRIAERRVRLGLLLSEIGQKNNVEISSQEMNQLIMQAAQQYGAEDRQKFVDYVRQEPMAQAQLRAPLFEDKVVDHLFGTATITERTVERAELEAAIEAEEGHVHGPDCDHDHDHGAKPAKKAPAAKKARPPLRPRRPRLKGAQGSQPLTSPSRKPLPLQRACAKEATSKD